MHHSHKKGKDFNALYTWNEMCRWLLPLGEAHRNLLLVKYETELWLQCWTFLTSHAAVFSPVYCWCATMTFLVIYNWGRLFFVMDNQQGPTTTRWATEFGGLCGWDGGLHLAKLKLEISKGRVRIWAYLRTSENPDFYSRPKVIGWLHGHWFINCVHMFPC